VHPFYPAAPTLHAPATMVAVMTLAGGGGRVMVGGGGGGGEQRVAHPRVMLGGASTSSAGGKTLRVDARHHLIPGQPRALVAGAARG
jgi:hypothetical protein